MTKGKQHGSGDGFAATRQWATQVIAIAENARQGGIEIRFDAEPSLLLQPKLRAMGFRHSRVKSMWYGDNTEQTREFAEQVKIALPGNQDGPELVLLPSADPVKPNIEKKEFSFVMITLKDGQTKSYVVFEPSKPKAEVIAGNFAEEQFGDLFLTLAVLPRTRLREARVLFDEEKIIYPQGLVTQAGNVSKDTEQPVAEITDEQQTIPTTLETNTKIDKRSTQAKIQMRFIELTIHHEGLTPDYAQGVIYHTWAGADDHVRNVLIGKVSDVYYKITWRDGEMFEGSIDLEPQEFYKDKPTPFSWFIKHYFTFFSKQQPSVISPPRKIEQAAKMVEHYSFEDEPTAQAGRNVKIAPRPEAVAHENDSGKTFVLLNRLIPILESGNEGDQHLEYYNSNGKKKRLIFAFVSHRYANNTYEVHLHDYIDNEQQLEITVVIVLPDNAVKVAWEWLSAGYSQKYQREETRREIEERGGNIGEEMERALCGWLADLTNKGITLTPVQSKVPNKHRLSDPEIGAKALTVDLSGENKFMPNVLVPAGTKEPFWSGNFHSINVSESIANEFPELLRITAKNLVQASPLELYMLLQLKKPSDYDIDLDVFEIGQAWYGDESKGGVSKLGFPSDFSYPYVSVDLGYQNIQSLGQVVFETKGSIQSNLVMAMVNYRPMADPELGAELLRKEIAKAVVSLNQSKEKKKLEGYIEDLQKGLKVVEVYLQKQPGIKGIYIPTLSDFDAKKMASLISSEKYLANAWSISNSRSTLSKNTFSKEETEQLKAFYAIYVLEDAEIQKKYKEMYSTLLTKSNAAGLSGETEIDAKQATGNNLEVIDIPMPKTAQCKATVEISLMPDGTYKLGMSVSKNFGDFQSSGFKPGGTEESYPDRNTALKKALDAIRSRLVQLLGTKDYILDNEEKKNKHLSAALSAVNKFATENLISFDDIRNADAEGIVSGLESAYWKKEDDEYPVDKVLIRGKEFNQARLRELISQKLQVLSIKTLEQIKDELSQKFTERNRLSVYEKSLVTHGLKGDHRKAMVIATYIDDMIIDHDLRNRQNAPVETFLVELLFLDSQRLADLPVQLDAPASMPKPTKKRSQYELNKKIEALIDAKDKTGSFYTTEERNYLKQYTGAGGLLKEGAVGRGALYEYYTPDEVVKKMWDMAYYYGYDGGTVLEPAVGIGNFLTYAPKDAVVYGFETNHYSARIAQILYPHAHIREKAFETLFFAGNVHLKDDFENPGFSLVIGNPPYGEFTGRYAGMGEKRHVGVTEYDQYFILRGLDVLKPAGLLIFLIPSNFLSNNAKYSKVKEKIAAKADFIDSYRLPGRLFQTTDIGTDILALKRK